MSIELYKILFYDSFISNLIITINTEVIYGTMKSFGTYNYLLTVGTATLACFVAFSINYLLGRLFAYFLEKKKQIINTKTPYIILLLLLSSVPFYGKFIPFFSGSFKVGYLKTMFFCSLIKFCCYLIF